MATYWLITAVVIGVLQVCATTPISAEEETDATKLFSASELERAKAAGIPEKKLIGGRSAGLSFEEILKIFDFHHKWNMEKGYSVEYANKMCEILVPDHKPADYSEDQEIDIEEFFVSVTRLARLDRHQFFRNSLCAYLSQPSLYETEASALGLQLHPYMRFRFLKMKNQNVSGVEHVPWTKKMCCVYKGRDHTTDLMDKLTFSDLADEDLFEFGERWAEFETKNTSKSFENLCDFLHSKNPSDECESAELFK